MKYLTAMIRRINSWVYCVITKILHPRRFFFKHGALISLSARLSMRDKGVMCLGRKVGIRRNTELSVSENGKLEIGDKCFFNSDIQIACHNKIVIGEGCRFGPGTKIFDHDYDYMEFESGKHLSTPIKIGNNVWVGANVVILRGTEIGDDCVIAAGTVLKGQYPENSLIVQKRETQVKLISR